MVLQVFKELGFTKFHPKKSQGITKVMRESIQKLCVVHGNVAKNLKESYIYIKISGLLLRSENTT